MHSKIHAVLTDYSTGHQNKHVGSTKGGNAQRLIFMLGVRQHVELENPGVDLAFEGKAIVWNTTWLDNSALAQVREMLDSKIDALNIDSLKPSDDNKFNIDPESINPRVKDMDVAPIFQGQAVDMTGLTSLDKLVLAMRVSSELAQRLDANQKSEVECGNVASFLKQLDVEIASFAIRTQIGLDRMVRVNLDAELGFEQLIRSINSTING